MVLDSEMKTLIEQEARHKTGNYLATLWFDIANFMKEQALNKQSMEHMKADMKKENERTNKIVSEWFIEMKALFKDYEKEIKETFATKTEHKQTANSVSMLWRWFVWAVIWLIASLWGIVTFFANKVI